VSKATLKDPDLPDPGAFLVSPEQADIVKENKPSTIVQKRAWYFL
jgi:hypothetical protein